MQVVAATVMGVVHVLEGKNGSEVSPFPLRTAEKILGSVLPIHLATGGAEGPGAREAARRAMLLQYSPLGGARGQGPGAVPTTEAELASAAASVASAAAQAGLPNMGAAVAPHLVRPAAAPLLGSPPHREARPY